MKISFRHIGVIGVIAAIVVCASAGGAGEARPRIVSLYAAHTEVLLRLGARDHIIGVSGQETYQGPETEGWEAPVFSFRDDVEKYLAARPDIVLVRPQHVAGGRHMKEALERAGIRVVALQAMRAEDLYAYWRQLAALVGREAEGDRMAAEFEEGIRPYREAAAGRVDKPGVFLEAIHREIKTFTPDSLPAWLVELSGGRNVAADVVPVSSGVIIAGFGPERLLLLADEIDIIVSQDGLMNRVTLEALLSRDIYRAVRAVKEGRVYRIPEALLARPTPSLLRGLEMLAGWTGLEVEKVGGAGRASQVILAEQEE